MSQNKTIFFFSKKCNYLYDKHMGVFVEIEKLILKFIWKCRDSEQSKQR